MDHRDYRFLGTTQSLCPTCMQLVQAKIIDRGGRVYFRKFCPSHGMREDFVCSDASAYDQLEYSVPARVPAKFGTQHQRGCPYDCGLCEEHEQHTCIGLVELTDACNLTCPMCYANSRPGLNHRSFDQIQQAIDRLVELEDGAEVLQLSGGEPTIVPCFESVVDYAMQQRIDYVQINTNGVRLARDPKLVEHLAQHRERLEVFLQFDGLDDSVYRHLRGEPLLDTKMKALDHLEQAGLNITLAVTLQAGINLDQVGPIVKLAAERPGVTAINFQPATYTGRHFLPNQLEQRVTFPDVIAAIEAQTEGMFDKHDFLPLPCAHPNCHQIAYAWRSPDGLQSIARMLELRDHIDLFANGISFTRDAARKLASEYLSRVACCPSGCGADTRQQEASTVLPVVDASATPPAAAINASDDLTATSLDDAADRFLRAVVSQQLGARDVFRITITSFLDAYNFDVRRLMKCCTHHILPSGHVIPFCAYNTLYRPGHVELPPLNGPLAVSQ